MNYKKQVDDLIEYAELNEIIKRANTRLRIPSSLDQACFRWVSDNKLIFIMDYGSPPKKKTHAGSLSFEFSHFGEKLVVSSGSPFVKDKKCPVFYFIGTAERIFITRSCTSSCTSSLSVQTPMKMLPSLQGGEIRLCCSSAYASMSRISYVKI